jgi:DNA-3-methyladenine glycosylase II
MRKVLNHFKKNDPKICVCLKDGVKIERLKPKNPDEYFSQLCRSIIFQQISGKAGDAILKRFLLLFPRKKITAKKILILDAIKMREAGISPQKLKYLKSLAEHFNEKKIKVGDFDKLSDEEIISELVKVTGIGRWTAEMFLMFTLAREDIFSFGDLGLKKGLMRVYGFKKYPSQKRIEKIINRWSPYKTYGCLALWHSVDKTD